MTKKILFMNNLFLPIAIVLCAISRCSGSLSDKQLCYDPECSVLVSLAKTTLKYTPSEEGILSFNANANAKVYSKGAGNRTDLWGVEINGKRGFAPKNFLREYKILKSDLKYEVPTQPSPSNNIKDNLENSKTGEQNGESDKSTVTPEETTKENTEEKANLNGASPAYEVVDGTTINFIPETTVKPTFVTEVVQATTATNAEQKDIPGVDILQAKSNETIFNKTHEKASVNLQQNVEGKENDLSEDTETKPSLDSSKVEIEVSDLSGIPTDIPVAISNIIEKQNDINTDEVQQNATAELHENVPEKQENSDAQILEQHDSFPANTTVNNIELPNNVSTSSVDNAESVVETSKDEALSIGKPENVQQESNVEEGSIQVNENAEKGSIQVNENAEKDNIQVNENAEKGSIQVNKNVKEDSIQVNENAEKDSIQVNETVKEGSIQIKENVEESSIQIKENIQQESVEKGSVQIKENVQQESVEKASIQIDESVIANVTTKSEAAINSNADILAGNNNYTQEGLKNEAIHENKQDAEVIKPPEFHGSPILASLAKKDMTKKPNNDINNMVEKSNNGTIEPEEKQKQDTTPEPVEDKSVSPDIPSPKENVISQSADNLITVLENQTATEELVVKEELENVPIELKPEAEIVQSDLKEAASETVQIPPLNTNESSIGDASTEIIEDKTISTVPQEITIVEEVTTVMPDANVLEIPAQTDSHATDGIVEVAETTQANTEHDFASNPGSAEDREPLAFDGTLNLQRSEEPLYSSPENLITEHNTGFNEFRNRNLLNAGETEPYNSETAATDNTDHLVGKTLPESGDDVNSVDDTMPIADARSSIALEAQMSSHGVCLADDACINTYEDMQQPQSDVDASETEDNAIMTRIPLEQNYWLTLMYVTTTAVTLLVFCLGSYYIENMRRDRQLIAKINKLEKDLLIATKECTVLTDNLTLTKEKLTCIEDESFGSNEMVLSLKLDLEALQNGKAELEDQVTMLERDLESATEAGLELERMLREVLSSNNEVNPLAESVEDLQGRLNTQQAENESLINALNTKTRENETLQQGLANVKKTLEQFEHASKEVTASLKEELEIKNGTERALTDKVQRLEMQLKEISTQKATLEKELRSREVELKDLSDVVTQLNCNNLDLNKLYEVSHIKAEATAVLEERNELRIRLSEVEGAHNLLEEHMKLVREEVASLTEQCNLAEKEKKDAETRLEVLSTFFNEKEAQRQKEEAIWLQKQGEVVSTVERIQSMQNEIQNYKQHIEMLKREILDQEREYKSQISLLESKAHEQWVVARQVERRLDESKAEAGQLRNRLTLIEKNINDTDPESKLHRLEANGDTATSPPPLFMGPDSSSSPIMFSGPSGVLPPPPPPSYMHHSIFPPYMPPPIPSGGGPPFDVGQRPPPLGGRLSSPPPMPMPGSASGRYDNVNSPPPPMSPHLLPPFNHRSPPPPPFGNDHLHPLPPGSILPPPLGSTHSWGEETLPPLRNSSFHPHQRDQRVRNHKGSLHSSGESLDRSHHNSKV